MDEKAPTRPPVGNFRSVPNNTPRGSMAPSSITTEPPKAVAPPVVEEPPAPEPKEEPEVPKTPAELYQERLAAAGITHTQAQIIIDSVLEHDYYEEEFTLRNQQGIVRTRSYEDILRMQQELDQAKPATQLGQNELMNRCNLASSLVRWRNQAFKHETDADFKTNLALIRKLPGPVMSLLIDQLAKFDAKVMIVFSDGATDSF